MNIIEISDFNHPGLRAYKSCNEAQLLHFYEPAPGLFLAESPNVISRAIGAGYQPESFLVASSQLEDAKALYAQWEKENASGANTIPEDYSQKKQTQEPLIYVGPESLLQELTGFAMTRGVLAAMRRRPLPSPESLCRNAHRIAILEDVVNPTNVGAILRSAAALGMEAVLLTPNCADPLYRRAARVSMGTAFQIPWTYIPQANDVKAYGFKTLAMALKDNTLSIADPRLQQEERLAIVLGSEGPGLRQETIEACDYTVKIPMAYGVDSLNVAAASAVAFWELSKKLEKNE